MIDQNEFNNESKQCSRSDSIRSNHDRVVGDYAPLFNSPFNFVSYTLKAFVPQRKQREQCNVPELEQPREVLPRNTSLRSKQSQEGCKPTPQRRKSFFSADQTLPKRDTRNSPSSRANLYPRPSPSTGPLSVDKHQDCNDNGVSVHTEIDLSNFWKLEGHESPSADHSSLDFSGQSGSSYGSKSTRTDSHIQNSVEPMDFKEVDLKLQADYIPKTLNWFPKKINLLLKSKDNSIMWLNSGEGTGKSTMSWLASTNILSPAMLGSIFFCQRDNPESRKAVVVVITIARDLGSKFPVYADYLRQLEESYLAVGNSAILSAPIEEIFKIVVVDGLKLIEHKQPVLIIIDAIDECENVDHERIDLLKMIGFAQRSLPTFVKLLVTAQPEIDIWQSLNTLNIKVLEPSRKKTLKDIKVFITSRLKQMKMYDKKLLQDILRKSNCSIIYARCACDYIETFIARDLRAIKEAVAGLPTGIRELYHHYISAAQQETEHDNDVTLVLGILCCQQRPLSRQQISLLSGISEIRVGAVMIVLRRLIHVDTQGLISVRHKSVCRIFSRVDGLPDQRI